VLDVVEPAKSAKKLWFLLKIFIIMINFV